MTPQIEAAHLCEDDVLNYAIQYIVTRGEVYINECISPLIRQLSFKIGADMKILSRKPLVIAKCKFKGFRNVEVDLLIKVKLSINYGTLAEEVNMYLPIEAKGAEGEFKKAIGQAKFLQELFGTAQILIPSNNASYSGHAMHFRNILQKEGIGLIIYDVSRNRFHIEIPPRIDDYYLGTLCRAYYLYEIRERLSALMRLLNMMTQNSNAIEDFVNALKKRGYSIDEQLLRCSIGKYLLPTYCIHNVKLSYYRADKVFEGILRRSRDLIKSLLMFLILDSNVLLYIARCSVDEDAKFERLAILSSLSGIPKEELLNLVDLERLRKILEHTDLVRDI